MKRFDFASCLFCVLALLACKGEPRASGGGGRAAHGGTSIGATSSTSGDGSAPASAAASTSSSAGSSSGAASSSSGGASSSSASSSGQAPVCGVQNAPPGDLDQHLQVGADTRLARVHVPPGLGPNELVPVVLAFHGGGHTATIFESMTHLRDEADKERFVLVEAEGLGALGPWTNGVLETWNAGSCCEASALNKVDDVGFARAILDDLATRVCVDPKRVYATGFSNGAMLSHRLACELSDRIAAIAAVSGGSGHVDYDANPHTILYDCTPLRPMPILHVHGTQDACYPFAGGFGPLSMVTFEAVQTTIDDWAAIDGCSKTPPQTVYAHGDATCTQYTCPAPGDVTLCTIQGGGHYWPGGDDWPGSTFFCGFTQGKRSPDLATNEFLWDYFKAHPMP